MTFKVKLGEEMQLAASETAKGAGIARASISCTGKRCRCLITLERHVQSNYCTHWAEGPKEIS
jgi:hypothetical protein